MRTALRLTAIALTAATLSAATVVDTRGPAGAATELKARPGSELAVDKTHSYTMTGRIRPLFFWINRANVGGGRIVWRRGQASAAAYELLIGSDPKRSPNSINKWGFIAEESRGTTGSLLALMSVSDERTLKDLDAAISKAGGRFFAIEARVVPGSAAASVATVHTPEPFTYRDVDKVLDYAHRQLGLETVSSQIVPDGTRTGFLATMAELIHTSVRARHMAGSQARPMEAVTIPYMYGRTFHDLTMKWDELITNVEVGGRTYSRAIRARFETRSRASGERYRFDLVYGMDDALAEVPLAIIYQPRWWLQVELTLDDGAPAHE